MRAVPSETDADDERTGAYDVEALCRLLRLRYSRWRVLGMPILCARRLRTYEFRKERKKVLKATAQKSSKPTATTCHSMSLGKNKWSEELSLNSIVGGAKQKAPWSHVIGPGAFAL